jgi:hypothetical protein
MNEVDFRNANNDKVKELCVQNLENSELAPFSVREGIFYRFSAGHLRIHWAPTLFACYFYIPSCQRAVVIDGDHPLYPRIRLALTVAMLSC